MFEKLGFQKFENKSIEAIKKIESLEQQSIESCENFWKGLNWPSEQIQPYLVYGRPRAKIGNEKYFYS
jgi:hypothetical protein